jgi:hypothetical protein
MNMYCSHAWSCLDCHPQARKNIMERSCTRRCLGSQTQRPSSLFCTFSSSTFAARTLSRRLVTPDAIVALFTGCIFADVHVCCQELKGIWPITERSQSQEFLKVRLIVFVHVSTIAAKPVLETHPDGDAYLIIAESWRLAQGTQRCRRY